MIKTLVHQGVRLSYFEKGAGLPVVFLHPTPVDHVYWIPVIECGSGIRVLAPDFRGHGASELGTDLPVGLFPGAPEVPVLTIAQLATDALALLNHASIPEAVFVGCSVGGYVMFELWRVAPERVRGLAFVCSKPQPDGDTNLAKRVEIIAKARAGQIQALFDSMAQSLIGASARARRAGIVSELRPRMTLTPEAEVAVQAGLATRPDSVRTVSTIRVPVLAIAGGEDESVTPSEMEALRAAPGGCIYHLLPDAGHFAAYEQPDKVGGLLQQWLLQFASK